MGLLLARALSSRAATLEQGSVRILRSRGQLRTGTAASDFQCLHIFDYMPVFAKVSLLYHN